MELVTTMIDITLTPVELMIAATVGSMRRVSSIKDCYNKNKHADKSDWATDIDGAAAEMALAKHFGCYWNGSNRSFKDPDLGNWQVRSTSHPLGHLIIRPNDATDDPNVAYALIITNPPTFSIVGHISFKRAAMDEYWNQDAWWVPQQDLTPFGT